MPADAGTRGAPERTLRVVTSRAVWALALLGVVGVVAGDLQDVNAFTALRVMSRIAPGCTACGRILERLQSFTEAGTSRRLYVNVCPVCFLTTGIAERAADLPPGHPTLVLAAAQKAKVKCKVYGL